MFNYNLVDQLHWTLVLFYACIWLCFVFGNWISAKFLNPEHKDWGRIFMGALLLLGIHIFFSILSAWKSVLPFMYRNPIIGVIAMFVSWFFVCKYLYGHSWFKTIIAALLPLIVAAAAIAIFYFVAPETLMSWTSLRLM